MRTKVTLVLLFLNVVLFFYVFYYERPLRTELEARELRRAVLPAEVAGMEAFTRTLATEPAVRAEKRADGWWLTQPYEWPANPNAISRVHNELQFLRNETKFRVADLVATGQTLADYGLEAPALTLAFDAGGRTQVLKVGDVTQSGNRLYVLSPDEEHIHVVSRSLAESLGLPLADLRSDSIFTIPVFEVRSLGVQTGELKTRLRRDAARWSYETPILARASKAAVEVTVNALNALRARQFFEPIDPAVQNAGLNQPALRVTLEGNARRETLLIGAAAPAPPRPAAPDAAAPEPHYFARIEDKDVIFTTAIPPALFETLRGAQETLRDARILDFEVANINAVTLVAPGTAPVTLQRLETAAGAAEADAWQLVTRGIEGRPPNTRPADSALVRALLERLHGLTALKFVTDAPSAADREGFGFNRPEREITLAFTSTRTTTDPTSLTLQVGVAPDRRDTAFAQLAHAPSVYQVTPEILRETPVDALHYRQRVLRELPTGARVTSLRLVRLADDTPVFALTAPGEAGLTAAAVAAASLPEAQRPAVATVLEAARTLRARRFVAESFNPAQAELEGVAHPWAYRLEIGIALVGGNGASPPEMFNLHLTERLGGTTQLAGTAEFGGVTFEVRQELLDALFTLAYAATRDPGPPAAPAETPAPATPIEPPARPGGT